MALPLVSARLAAYAVLAAAVLAVLVWAPAAAVAAQAQNGAIAYEGRASTRGYLYLRKPNGSLVRRLRTIGRPSAPSVSPLGRRIAFSSAGQIWTVYTDGAVLRQVTSGPLLARTPTWSPAGDALAFASGPGDAQDLYRVGADGAGLLRLTYRTADEEDPAWSSRDRIAFVRRAPRHDGNIVTIAGAGGPSQQLTRGKPDDSQPAWSPDGRLLAFTRDGPRVHELRVMRFDGSRQKRLARLPRRVISPAWSPDGRSIAFALKGRGGRRSLYVLRREGRRLRRVGSGTSDPRALDWQATGFDPVVAAAGDVACDPASPNYNDGEGERIRCGQRATSDLMFKMDLSAILALGDLQYQDGQFAKFTQSFDSTWGRLKPLIRPAVGNHEYRVPGAAGYFDYFNGVGQADGPAGPRGLGYYSFDVGRWHVVALNSECGEAVPAAGSPTCVAGSPQERWLRADLAANPRRCTLAMFHHPVVSSGLLRGVNVRISPLWQALSDYGVDVALVGHDHAYERFAPINAAGARDPARGVREFVVGTGGKSLRRDAWFAPNSQLRDTDVLGVLELTLRPTGYAWNFVNAGTPRFTDSGSAACH